MHFRGNRSLRVITGRMVEIYHQGHILRSAFPPLYYIRLEEDKTYTIAEGVTVTTAQVLQYVKEMNETAFPCGINPIEFYNKTSRTVVVDIASKVVSLADVDKGIYFEVPLAMIVSDKCISREHFDELIEEIQ